MPDEEADFYKTSLAMTSPDGSKAVSSSSANGVTGQSPLVLPGKKDLLISISFQSSLSNFLKVVNQWAKRICWPLLSST